jgi:hypothetical protein
MLDVDIEHVEAGGFGCAISMLRTKRTVIEATISLRASFSFTVLRTISFACIIHSHGFLTLSLRVWRRWPRMELSSSAPTPIPRFPIRPNGSRRKIDLHGEARPVGMFAALGREVRLGGGLSLHCPLI